MTGQGSQRVKAGEAQLAQLAAWLQRRMLELQVAEGRRITNAEFARRMGASRQELHRLVKGPAVAVPGRPGQAGGGVWGRGL
jgi:hypothetical protein